MQAGPLQVLIPLRFLHLDLILYLCQNLSRLVHSLETGWFVCVYACLCVWRASGLYCCFYVYRLFVRLLSARVCWPFTLALLQGDKNRCERINSRRFDGTNGDCE